MDKEAARAAIQAAGWRDDMKNAPRDRVIYMRFKHGIIATGRYRIGTLGEPQDWELAWRCECCGRFGNPTHWKLLDAPDSVAAHLEAALDRIEKLEAENQRLRGGAYSISPSRFAGAGT